MDLSPEEKAALEKAHDNVVLLYSQKWNSDKSVSEFTIKTLIDKGLLQCIGTPGPFLTGYTFALTDAGMDVVSAQQTRETAAIEKDA